MLDKETLKILLRMRGAVFILLSIAFLVFSATSGVGAFKFDPVGRIIFIIFAIPLFIYGVVFIKRDRPIFGDEEQSGCALNSRKALPLPQEWEQALRAKDILIIGHNLNIIFRQIEFFRKKLEEDTQLRLIIVNPRNNVLIDILKRGVVEYQNTEPDFVSFLDSITTLRNELPKNKRNLIDLRTIEYVPTSSFTVLDGRKRWGTIIVELTPNKMTVQERPHFQLHSENPAHAEWYERLVENCNGMHLAAKPWQWS